MLVIPKLGDDVLKTDVDQSKAINEAGIFTKVISTLPSVNQPKSFTVDEKFNNAHIVSFRLRNANNAWISGVGEAHTVTDNWGIRVRLLGRTMTIWNGLTDLSNNTIEVILIKDEFVGGG